MPTVKHPAQLKTVTNGRTSVTPERLRSTPRIPVADSKVRTTIHEKPARTNPRPGN